MHISRRQHSTVDHKTALRTQRRAQRRPEERQGPRGSADSKDCAATSADNAVADGPVESSAADAPAESVPAQSGVRANGAFDPLGLVARYQDLVRQIVGGFQRKLPRNVLRDDLMAAGMTGLWDAVRKHGHEASPNFDWYVRVRIRGAILDELRAQDWLPRRARAQAAEANKGNGAFGDGAPVVLRFDEVSESEQARCLAADDGYNAERVLELNATRARLFEAMQQLPERERHIVAMHYFRGLKFKDLGEMLGVSEPRVSQLHSRAMGRLRSLLSEAA
jgi:RNA polymerase sigma factor FliA